MLVTSSDNPTPKVGQIFYLEYRAEDGKFQNASLNFIDEKPKEGKQWMYTQIALIEGGEDKLTTYAGFEAGGMPPKHTRIASDEDVLKFIELIRAGKITEDSPKFNDWLIEIRNDNSLLKEEKERIDRLTSI